MAARRAGAGGSKPVGVGSITSNEHLQRRLSVADEATRATLIYDLQRDHGNAAVADLIQWLSVSDRTTPMKVSAASGAGTLQRDGDGGDFMPTAVSVAPVHGKGDPDEASVEGSSSISVHGQANAKFNGGAWHTEKVKATTSAECGECPPKSKCLHVIGDQVTVYKVKVKITLPGVPAGLSRCEAAAVKQFINTTLKKHENDHRTRFQSVYNGKTVNPFDLTGCGMASITEQLKAAQASENHDREAAANAKSGEIDPFDEPIPMNCDEDS